MADVFHLLTIFVVRHQDDDRCVPFIDNLREGSESSSSSTCILSRPLMWVCILFSTLTKRFSNLSVNYRYRLGHGTVVRHQDDDRCVPFIDNLREGSGSRRHENLADSILKTVHRLLINTQDPLTLTCELPPHDGSSTSSSWWQMCFIYWQSS